MIRRAISPRLAMSSDSIIAPFPSGVVPCGGGSFSGR
jgi:hypothetical protein